MKQFVVDAFTRSVFAGNPAAVCIMDSWPQDAKMLAITKENNLSETAFAVKQGDKYALRWFTPGGEIDLCGHATLAAAYVIMRFYDKAAQRVTFSTLSGLLTVTKKGELYEMEFPAYELKRVEVTPAMVQAMGAAPQEAYLGRDLLCVFDSAATVKAMQPRLEKVQELAGLLLQVTAPGEGTDCLSRTFAPKLAVAEDPVCGSGHCHIVPYWAQRLGKKEIVAYQASPRGGMLYCRHEGSRVFLAGHAALYSQAEIYVD